MPFLELSFILRRDVSISNEESKNQVNNASTIQFHLLNFHVKNFQQILNSETPQISADNMSTQVEPDPEYVINIDKNDSGTVHTNAEQNSIVRYNHHYNRYILL